MSALAYVAAHRMPKSGETHKSPSLSRDCPLAMRAYLTSRCTRPRQRRTLFPTPALPANAHARHADAGAYKLTGHV